MCGDVVHLTVSGHHTYHFNLTEEPQMAKKSDLLVKALFAQLKTERDIDVGLLDEVASIHQRQADELRREWDEQKQAIEANREQNIKEITVKADQELEGVNEMFSALINMNNMANDKLSVYSKKIAAEAVHELEGSTATATIAAPTTPTPSIPVKVAKGL